MPCKFYCNIFSKTIILLKECYSSACSKIMFDSKDTTSSKRQKHSPLPKHKRRLCFCFVKDRWRTADDNSGSAVPA